MFFGPLAYTIIFGLSIATFLTLILIPVMYYIGYTGRLRFRRARHKSKMETRRELFGEDGLME